MLKTKIKKAIGFFCKNRRQGSVLAYSLIVIFIMVFIAASASVVTVIEKKASVSTNSSVQSYQVADSGAQLAFKKINSALYADKNATIGNAFSGCANGIAEESMAGTTLENTYTINFKDSSNADLGCDSKLSDVARIKSVGKYKNIARAVEIEVASKKCSEKTICGSSCFYSGNEYSTVEIGIGPNKQCWFRENLRAKYKPNGTELFNEDSYWCYGSGFPLSGCTDTQDGMIYGPLYQWHTANDLDSSCMSNSCTPSNPNRGLCPDGWHIPTVAEFNTLISNGGNLRTVDSTHFSGILPGYVEWISGWRDSKGLWWSSEQDGSSNGKHLNLDNSGDATIESNLKGRAASVRCVQN